MNTIKRSELLITSGAVIALVVSFVIFYNQANIMLGVLALFAILLVFFYKPNVALYIIAAIYPFTLFQFVYGSLNAPYVDMVALILFTTFALKKFNDLIQGKLSLNEKEFPAWPWFSVFIVTAVLSLSGVDSAYIGESIKYIFRPLLFFYLMYLVLPLHFITSRKVLMSMLRIMFGVGLLLALGGLYQFLFGSKGLGFRRAFPFGVGSFYPLGYNHNLLSEALIAIIPIAFIFYYREKDVLKRYLYLASIVFMAGITFLTFSRAGWLALLVEAIVFFIFLYRQKISRDMYKILSWLFAVALIPFGIILYYLNSTPIAQGSNLNRIKLIEIALDLFKHHPFFGAGVGTFYKSVEQIRWYIIEYGGALDAHGMFFKVLSETGILGTVAFFGFLISIFYYVFARYLKIKDKEWALVVLGLIVVSVGIVVFEWFGTSYYIAKMWLPIGLTLVAVNLIKEKHER